MQCVHDRARVQVGKISAFGLLELSRQRLRPNIIESSSLPCTACRGTGMIRSVESSSLHVLRAIEEEAIQQKVTEIIVYVPVSIALYILNQKRNMVHDMETRWNLTIRFSRDDTLIPPDYRIERIRLKPDATSQGSAGAFKKREEKKGAHQVQSHAEGQNQMNRARRHDRTPQARPIRVQQTPTDGHEVSEASHPSVTTDVHSPHKEGQARSKSRRRYRKFDRRPNRQSQEGERPVSESIPAQPHMSPPQPHREVLPPQDNAPKVKTATQKADEGTTPRKKGATRKGWWQRLLE